MSEYAPFSDDPNGDDDPEVEDRIDELRNYERKFRPGTSTLGLAARQRRELLRITQEDVAERFGGPSVASLRTIETVQSESYRAKTLYSLDAALSWPRGASMALLSGRLDRMDHRDLKRHQLDQWSRNPHSLDLTEQGFDRLVNDLIHVMTDDDIVRYDIPVRSGITTIVMDALPEMQPFSDEPNEQIPGQGKVSIVLDGRHGTSKFDDVIDEIAAMGVTELNDFSIMIYQLASSAKRFDELSDEIQSEKGESIAATLRREIASKIKIWHRFQQEIHRRDGDGKR